MTSQWLDSDKTKEVNPGWYETYSYLEVEDYFWWTRTPEADEASKAYLVSNSYYYEDNQTITMSVGCEGYGIRPAMTIKIK